MKGGLFLESSPFLPDPGRCSTSPQHQQSPPHSSGSGWWVAGGPEPNPRPWCFFLCQHTPRAEEGDRQKERRKEGWRLLCKEINLHIHTKTIDPPSVCFTSFIAGFHYKLVPIQHTVCDLGNICDDIWHVCVAITTITCRCCFHETDRSSRWVVSDVFCNRTSHILYSFKHYRYRRS